MNAVQQAIQNELEAGKTQAALAREIGVKGPTLHNALHNKRMPHAKILKYFGIKRVISFLPEGEEPAPELGARVPRRQKLRASLRLKRERLAAARDAKVKESGSHLPTVSALPASEILTAVRAQVAMRYGLKAGPAWHDFSAQADFVGDASIDERWAAYCANVGNLQGASSPAEDGALGRPGELYSHLKPVKRGPDLRGPTEVISTGIASGGVRVIPRE